MTTSTTFNSQPCMCMMTPCPHKSFSENSKALDKLVALGYLTGYHITKKYEEPGVEMRTSEEIEIIFPMGATLTISGISSGVNENVALELTPGHLLVG